MHFSRPSALAGVVLALALPLSALAQDEDQETRERLRVLEAQLDEIRAEQEAVDVGTELPLDLRTNISGYAATSAGFNEHTPVSFQLAELMLSYSANLDRWATFRADTIIEGNDDGGISLELPRVHATFKSDDFRLVVGQMPSPLSHWNEVAQHAAYLYLPVEGPEALGHDAVITHHQLGMRGTYTPSIGYWRLNTDFMISNGRGSAAHSDPLHGDQILSKAFFASVGVVSPGGLTIAAGGQYELVLPADETLEGHVMEDPDPMDMEVSHVFEHPLHEVVGTARVLFDGSRVTLWSEGFMVFHQRQDGGDISLGLSGYILGGYRIGQSTPFVMLQRTNRPETSDIYLAEGNTETAVKASLGFRYDLALRASLKVEASAAVSEEEQDATVAGIGNVAPGASAQLAVRF